VRARSCVCVWRECELHEVFDLSATAHYTLRSRSVYSRVFWLFKLYDVHSRVYYWQFVKIRFLLHFCVLKKTIILLSTGSITTTGALRRVPCCRYNIFMSIPSLSFYSYRSRARRSSLSRPFTANSWYTPKTGPLGYLVHGRSVPVRSTLLRLYYVISMHVRARACVCVCVRIIIKKSLAHTTASRTDPTQPPMFQNTTVSTIEMPFLRIYSTTCVRFVQWRKAKDSCSAAMLMGIFFLFVFVLTTPAHTPSRCSG